MIEEERRIKLIWDFHGPDAKKTAEHHAIHLNDFKLVKNDVSILEVGTEEINESFYIAFLITRKTEMIRLRDVLKPKRGEYVD
jgi:hypothetical protein